MVLNQKVIFHDDCYEFFQEDQYIEVIALIPCFPPFTPSVSLLGIQLENILVDKNGVVRICNFGCAAHFDPSWSGRRETLLTTICGTLEYTPPEVEQLPP
ncbi:unnamed protein product [Choristocarpus tenellus]